MKAIVAIERSARALLRQSGEAVLWKPFSAGAEARAMRLSNASLFKSAAFLLIAPNALFAASLNWAPAILVWIGCVVALLTILLWSPVESGLLSARVDPRALLGCLIAAFALCVFGGEGHFFYSLPDWLWRDAVLADVVKNGPATLYQHYGQTYLLRAPLGMYLSPMLVGAHFGLLAAHYAMLVQNGFILTVALYLLSQIASAPRLPFLAVFILFSGLDVLPTLFLEAVETFKGTGFIPFNDMEWWTSYWTKNGIEYSSNLTLLFWVPNHTIPGWWFAVLALLYVRREIDLAMIGVTFAASIIWSPLSMMGAVPYIAMFGLGLSWRQLLEPRLLVAAAGALGFLPILAYLAVDAGSVPHQALIFLEGFAPLYLAFLAVEIPHVAVVALGWRLVPETDRRLLLLSIALLVVIPFYQIGESNDFVMRASITPLFLLAFGFSRIAALTPRDNGGLATLIGALVILSFGTPMLVLKQALATPAYAISDCNLMTATRKTAPKMLPTNYFARVEFLPTWLMTVEGSPNREEARRCWPDHPLLEDRLK